MPAPREPASPDDAKADSKAGEQRSPTSTDTPAPATREGVDKEHDSPGRRWGDALGIERDSAPLDE